MSTEYSPKLESNTGLIINAFNSSSYDVVELVSYKTLLLLLSDESLSNNAPATV